MPNLTITINQPLLATGQHFKERHRILPSGAWSSYTNRSNAPFTVTGLTAGDYQFEFILVKANGTECNTKSYTYTVTDAETFECIDFTITQLANPDKLKIAYTVPVGYTPPACGYNLGYRSDPATGFASVHYATLPPSPFYVALPASTDLYVRVTADLCDAAKICYDELVPKPPEQPCETPMHNIVPPVYSPEYLGVQPSGLIRYKLRVFFGQSTPPCLSIAVRINQVGVTNGTPSSYFNPAIPIAANDTYIDIIFDFNPAVRNRSLQYEGSIIDCCDKSLYFSGGINHPF